jgi:ubiquinone/menaquinone biosynthesis C-methylase UbiE
MEDWIDYYDSTHTIYASKLHRDLHFQVVAKDIIGYISSPEAVVLDYACGEALSAARVAEACGKLYLAERPADRALCPEHEDQGAFAG